MIKKLIMACLLVTSLCLTLDARPLNLNQITEATCRISAPKFRQNGMDYGTGTCIHETANFYYIITNAHVVGNNPAVYCEFFKLGKKSTRKYGKVVWRRFQENTDIDLALIAINKNQFSTFKPRAIPLVQPNHNVLQGSYVYSAGCPNAQWVYAWEGIALQGKDNRVFFVPPPEGGQSGSGVCVLVHKNGEYYTRIAGVITWRVGEQEKRYGLDANGYPLQRGAAIPVSTLYNLINQKTVTPIRIPVHWQTVSTYKGYALGSDGNYYSATWKEGAGWECRPPWGVTVQCWPRNPNGGCLPPILDGLRPRPAQPQPQPLPIPPPQTNPAPGQTPTPTPGQPPGQTPNPAPSIPPDLWGKDDDVKVTKLEEEIKILKNQIEAANKRIDGLTTSNNSFAAEKKRLTDAIKDKEAAVLAKEKELIDLVAKYNELNSKVSTFEGTLKEKSDKLNTAQSAIDDFNSVVEDKDNKIDEQSEELKTLNDNIANLNEEKVSFLGIRERLEARTTERNMGGGLALGGIALALYFWWSKRGGKEMIHEKADAVQDTLNVKIDNLQSSVDDRLRNYISEETIAGIRDKIDNLQQGVNGRIDGVQSNVSQLIEDAIKDNLPGIVQRVVDRRAPANNTNDTTITPVSTSGDGSPPVNPINNDPSPRMTDKAKKSPYIKELFDLKLQNGERIEDWAALGVLYREAMVLLREGKMYYQANNPLQGQQRTADRVNDWVEKELLNRSNIKELQELDTLHYNAICGFLYKDAMRRLKEGKFNALGAMETSDVVERWVRKELFQRLNINLN